MVDAVVRLQVGLEVCEQLLPDVRRVAQNNVKTSACIGACISTCIGRCIFTVICYIINSKLRLPFTRQGIKRCITYQTVAMVEVGLQTGQFAAQFSGFKP